MGFKLDYFIKQVKDLIVLDQRNKNSKNDNKYAKSKFYVT